MGRAILALLMISSAGSDSLLLFPEAFGMLVLAKSYTVAKAALVPTVVVGDHALVEANSKLQVLSGDVTFAGFYDAGRVQVNNNPLNVTSANFQGLSGYGLGVTVGKDNDFLLKTSVAWRGENDVPDADRGAQFGCVLAQVAKGLFAVSKGHGPYSQ